MSLRRATPRLGSELATGASIAARGGALALAAVAVCASTVAVGAAGGPSIATDRGCYLVGQAVNFRGTGFAPGRQYEVTVDGVDFGHSTTDAVGGFSASLRPGGLAAGYVQEVDQLQASDGSRTAGARFTLTRKTGARFLVARGNPNTLRAPFQVWGFTGDGARRKVYLHYLSPGGRVRTTIAIGRAGGQCGYLLTAPRRVFPFTPSSGTWALQLDAKRTYRSRPGGPVARIRVRIQGG